MNKRVAHFIYATTLGLSLVAPSTGAAVANALIAGQTAPMMMDIGGPAPQMEGQERFCHDFGDDRYWAVLCDQHYLGALDPFDAAPDNLDRVQDINLRINRAILPYEDSDTYHREDEWIPASLFGDCEDIVMAKKLALHNELNIPMHQLSMAVVLTEDNVGHAVLLLHSNQGTFVLDNLSQQLTRWENTSHRFIQREHRRYGQQWVRINDTLTP